MGEYPANRDTAARAASALKTWAAEHNHYTEYTDGHLIIEPESPAGRLYVQLDDDTAILSIWLFRPWPAGAVEVARFRLAPYIWRAQVAAATTTATAFASTPVAELA